VAEDTQTPLLEHDPEDSPVFLPGNLIEAARRQKGLPRGTVPPGCLLDFDGELVELLVSTGRGKQDPSWPCYHTKLFRWRREDTEYGIIGGTVGAPYAVLVAEELFATGCRALISISSAGLIAENLAPPFFLLIERALRDEGTSHHYLPPKRFVSPDPALVAFVERRLADFPAPVRKGTSWTTDAPFRETKRLIASRRSEGIVSVEMEAAALLAMGEALRRPVLCLAQVTNAMATRTDDFEKGGDRGLETTLSLCSRALDAVLEFSGRKGFHP
jgi:uridine phosphorylase